MVCKYLVYLYYILQIKIVLYNSMHAFQTFKNDGISVAYSQYA